MFEIKSRSLAKTKPWHTKANALKSSMLKAAIVSILGVSNIAFGDEPGGVSAGLELWLKPQIGTDTTVDQNGVSAWSDQSTNALSISQASAGSQPLYQDGTKRSNFNPILSFDGVDDYFEGSVAPMTDASEVNVFTISIKDDTGGAGLLSFSPGFYSRFNLQPSRGISFFDVGTIGGPGGRAGGAEIVPRGTIGLSTAVNSISNSSFSWARNSLPLAGNAIGANPAAAEPFEYVSAGRIFNNAHEYWGGDIAEIVAYSRDLSASEKQAVESYLAIKYGITLDQSTLHDYTSSTGASVFVPDASYQSNIFGLGQDDGSGLDQRVSKSVNSDAIVTLATDADFTTANNSSRTSIGNANYFMIGNNDGAAVWTATGAPFSYLLLDKQWIAQESGSVGNVHIEFSVSESNFDIPDLQIGTQYYLFIDTDNDQDLSDETAVALTNTSAGLWSANVDFADNAIFSLASSADTDSDGIPDSIEGSGDSDGDGTPDYQDSDSDNDGISDDAEGSNDTDGDGSPDYLDTDSENDGVPDLTEGSGDTDGDGIPDNLDIDSDNDGILDNHEHGLTSANASGLVVPDFVSVHATDLRDSGFTLNFTGTEGHSDISVTAIGMDADFTDGVWTSSIPEGYRLSNVNEITWQFSQQVVVRFDFQYTQDSGNETYSLTVDGKVVLSGTPGDQVIDVVGREFSVVGSSGGIGLYLNVDSHSTATTTGLDTDLDSVVDRLDLDSDNDGISDLFESGNLSGINADADGNGTLDLAESIDNQNDGRMDVYGQYIMDSNTGWTPTNAARPANVRHFPANNGVSPTAGSTYIHFDTLTGSYAYSEFLPLDEVFHSGVYQFSIDVSNIGNLGWPVSSFAQPTSGVSASAVGTGVIPTASNTPVPASGTTETWTYTLEVATNSPLIGQTIGFEAGVGVPNGLNENVGFDNLQMTVAPLDTDADALGDFRDLDSDQDGIADTIEARFTAAYVDHANNGSGNVDADGDGVLDLFDSNLVFGGTHSSLVAPVNTDGVGEPDFLDTDSDNDGLLDSVESGLAALADASYADPDGIAGLPRDSGNTAERDYRELDSDGDGINDSVEGNVDTDGDSTPDYRDTDSDNDGTDDSAEGVGDEDGDGIPDYRDNYFDVIQDAVVWLRADEGVTDAGSGVSVWTNQSSFGNDVSRAPSSAVSLIEGSPEFNFNPSVDFDGSVGSMLSATAPSSPADDETFIAVTRYTGNGPIEGVVSYGSKGIYVSGSSASHQYVVDGSGAGTATSSNSDALNNTGASLIGAFYRSESTNNSAFFTNGGLTENYLGSERIPTGTSTDLQVGGRTLGGLTQRVLEGQIAEIVQLSSDISGQTQQSILESYLATKYGISLDQTVPSNYVDSADAIVWNASTNAGYTSDIFGLSRDDFYDLDQRVSKSVSAGAILTIALDADFTSGNQSAARTTAHANDKQSLYLSNNGAATTSSTDEVPSNDPLLGNSRALREWRVTTSANFAETTHLKFAGFDDSYYAVVDNDGDFSSGATVLGRLTAAGEITGVSLSDGQYMTLVRGRDTDSDGTIDLIDTDDDNDGIPDSVEGNIDTDNDGIPNSLDTDSDGDGVPDATEGAGDTDSDGTPNYLDEDSDGDGVPDATEGDDTGIVVGAALVTGAEDTAIALGVSVNPAFLTGGPWPAVEFSASANNGSLSHGGIDSVSGAWVVDPADIASLSFIPAEHYSGEGTVFTINFDGENDTVEVDVTRVADAPLVTVVDQQGTQRVVANAADSYAASLVDLDGSEGLSVELTINAGHTISDGTNSFTATGGSNTVDVTAWNASTLTYLSDDVGVFPVGVRAVSTDTDGFSATPDVATTNDSFDITILIDTDADGDADIVDTDDDNDGISDVDEGVADTDGDGTPDSLDTDSDGDGVPDGIEGGGDADGDGILDHIDNDTDGDGILDADEGTNDSDGDSIPDFLDIDSDGDGLGDAAEGAIDSDGDGILDYLDIDSDGDGINDAVEGSIDTDGDGTLDYLDEDSDDDGISDSVEGAVDTDGDGAADYVDLDADGDGISDSVEGVVDTDGDGQVDFLDTDSDGDGIADIDEGNADTDGDGIPNSQDTDANNDGIPDADLGTGDQDGDGVPDYLDDDIDGDGIANASEGAPNPTDDSDGDGIPNYSDTDSDNDGINDGAEGSGDLDGDGIPDYLDSDSDGDGIADINEGSLDSDNDGIPDYADTDSDGDGVPDLTEGSADTDLDGIPDYLDLDVDGDGIPDADEGFNDSDGDGIADYKDLDSDNDGHGDGAEGTIDSDGDGIADYLDLDSDNDGLPDSDEASGDTDGDGIPDYLDDDSDNDGIPDGVEGLLDSDGDGALDYLDDDSDGDGIPDNLEGSGDADGDLIPDYLDSDSDNDGIPDSIEGSGDFDNDGIPDSIDTDANGDGIPDAALGSGDQDGDGIPDYLDGDIDGDGIANGTEGSVVPAEDSDGDGIPNYADTDSDNDGIPDFLEGTGDADGDGTPDAHDTDSDNDGLADSAEGILDSDNDGIPNNLDRDSDGDGIDDSIETSADTDLDGIPNYLDIDGDNDGISDAVEGSGDADGDGAPDFLDNDSDGDGITDGAEGSADTDADGIPDYLDSDSDGDGIPDVTEGSLDSDGDRIPDSQDTDANGDGIPDANLSDGDIDNDGIPDYLDGDIDGDGIPNGSEGALNPAADSDGDGIPNYADTDSDNDGIPDSEEGTGDADGDGLLDAFDADADNDGIPDGQEGTNDTDGDGVADYLDSDSDNDGIPDSIEGAVDSDGDGIPDSQDSDGNNDGIPDSLLGSGDLDGDGIPDYLDSDIDGDGVSNIDEAQPDATTDSDGDGFPDYIDSDSDNDGVPDSEESRGDTDGDGIPDFADTDADGDGVPDVAEGFGDTDGDGIADFIDLDADNDGIPDVTEGSEDTDEDGVLDAKDLDSDNDGLPDIVEAGGEDVDGNGRVDNYVDNNSDGYDDGMAAVPLPIDNSDSDALPDYKDLDSDNDGIPDTRESALSALDSNGDGRIDDAVDAQAQQPSSDFPGGSLLNDILDEDGDGWADNIPTDIIVDTDGDGTPNHQDLDSDGDGINDLTEAGGVDLDGDGQVDGWNDADADGIPDDIDADQLGSSDNDGDGIADFADADFLNEADADGDGIVDRFDIDPYDEGFARSASGEPVLGSALPDTDGDGISDVQQPINEQGFIRTGLGGGGSMNPLSLLALWFFTWGVSRQRRAAVLNPLNLIGRRRMQSRSRYSILTVALLLSVTGCSTIGYLPHGDEPVLGEAVPEQLKVGRHVYVAAGVGTSRLNPDTSEVTTFAVNDRKNAGQHITLGVDVSRQLSLELHSADLGAAGLTPEGGINYNMHGASALFYAGKNRHNYKRAGFTGYGRLGYGVMENSAAGNIPYRQEESNHLLVGAGLQYMTSVGLGFRVELISYEDDAQYGQLAIVYRMGSPRRGQNAIVAEHSSESNARNTSEPLLQAAVAVSQQVSACTAPVTDSDSVYFDTNSVVMSTEGRRLLKAVGQKLMSCDNLKLAVSAHTDEAGTDNYNQKLSQRRASVVTQHLLSMGVQPARIESNSYGETRPIAPNSTSEGQQLNRRVQMEIQ